jgi:TolB-like protein
MKKPVFGFIFLFFISLPVLAQGFYLDMGVGFSLGPRQTNFIEPQTNFGPDIGLRVGYDPFGNTPLFFVVEGSSISYHSPNAFRPELSSGTNNFVGGGAIFYPIPLIQMGAFLGVSYSTDTYSGVLTLESDAGFAWNISTAVDLGSRNHGCLIGLKYSGSINSIRYTEYFFEDDVYLFGTINDTLYSHFLGIFVKYTYRKKTSYQPASKKNTTESAKTPSRQSRSNAGIDGAIGRVSQELIKDLPEKTRVAVINITSNNGELSAYIVEELEYQLVASRKFTIVDRKTLDTIRSEQNFHTSGEVSDESAVSIGQMLGANIVITGSVSGTGTNQRLSIRVLDVKTAEIVTMVREEF